MADTRLELQVAANAQAAIQSLDSLLSAMNRVKDAVGKGFNLGNAEKSIGRIASAFGSALKEDVVQRYERMGVALQQISANNKVSIQISGNIGEATQQIQNLQNTLQATNSGTTVFGSATDAVSDAANQMREVGEAASGASAGLESAKTQFEGTTDAASGAAGQIKAAGDAAKNSESSTKSLAERLKELGKAFSNARGHSNNLLSSFIRIAKYRFLRAVLREIVEGVTVGVKNMYEYSKAIQSSFAPAVDAAKDALLRMKNSIGAALAPLIEMLIPYLMQAVQWFINLVNVVNQFLALLNGQTEWTRAITATSDAMDDVKSSAGGAAKAIKEVKGLLADWDELNIIQQQPGDTGSSGGGGSTKKAETDYTKMFEQVGVFDERIRNAVNWVKENFDTILSTAKLVGAAMLGWTVSTALGGIIGTLASWVTTGIIAKLTFDVVTKLDNNYLQTGLPGWLLANVLTTAFGAGIAASLVKKFVSVKHAGQAAAVGAAIVLTFSAAADIVAAVGNVDVSALDPKNLSLAVIGALKGGLAVAFVSHAFGAKMMQAGLLSLGSIGTIFGVEVGIKAVQGVVETGEITTETLAADVMSALTMGTGALFIAKGAGLGLSKAGLVGLAAAGLTVAVELGIETVVGAVNAKGLTGDNILKTLGAAGGAGIGTAAILLAGGASLPVAAAVGGGALFATGLLISAAIGISLSLPEKGGVQWGNVTLTEEQVQSFVSEKMFSTDVRTTINLLDSKVQASETELANVRTQARELFSTMNVLELGIDDAGSLKEAHTQVKNLISAIEAYAETQTAVLRTGISVIPVLNEAGEDVSADVLRAGITGWEGVTGYMHGLGEELSKALIDGTTGEMKTNWDTELVDTILKKVSNVNRAVMEAQAAGNAREQLGSTLFGLSDMSHESFDAIIQTYENYADQLKASMYNVYSQEISQFEQLAAYYRAMAENEAGTEKGAMYAQTAAEYAAEAERLAGLIETNVQAALDRELAQGKNLILDWLAKMFSEPLQKGNLSYFENHMQEHVGDFKGLMQDVISRWTGIPLDVMKLFDITGWDYLSDELKEKTLRHLKIYVDNGYFKEYGGIENLDEELAKLGITFPVTPVIEEADDVSDQLDDIVDEAASNYEVEVDTSALETPVVIPAAETSTFTSSVESAVTSVSASMEATARSTASTIMGEIDAVHQALLATINDWYFLTGGVTSNHNVGSRNSRISNYRTPHYAFASGGFPETGDYFFARESGPELVGTMGNRTAVANNDQIVAGIASGVAAAQQEQNTLLRQQNDYLRRILAKESTVKLEPSSRLGKINRQSEAMYAKNTGTGV